MWKMLNSFQSTPDCHSNPQSSQIFAVIRAQTCAAEHKSGCTVTVLWHGHMKPYYCSCLRCASR